jgi:hypothetical protein
MFVEVLTDKRNEELNNRLRSRAESPIKGGASTPKDDNSKSLTYEISNVVGIRMFNRDEKSVSKEASAMGSSNPDELVWKMCNLLSVRANKEGNEDIIEDMAQEETIELQQDSDTVNIRFRLDKISQFTVED